MEMLLTNDDEEIVPLPRGSSGVGMNWPSLRLEFPVRGNMHAQLPTLGSGEKSWTLKTQQI